MALLLETALGDVVIDIDTTEAIGRNIIKLAKVGYFAHHLTFRLTEDLAWTGCPVGDGSGGTSIYGLLDKGRDYERSSKRFLRSSSSGCSRNVAAGTVLAGLTSGVAHTFGSQFGLVLRETETDLPSIGVVAEDENNILNQLSLLPTDANQRPEADVRIFASVVYDPCEDPSGLKDYLDKNPFDDHATKPAEETVAIRLDVAELDIRGDEEEEDEATRRQRERELREVVSRREEKSRTAVLEMLGDLPSQSETGKEVLPPPNVLFVCKLNPVTTDEDLQLIFSRFDENVSVQIIRDMDTGASLQYAFCSFCTEKAANEAYFKLNNALIDDRRIKVDWSQSVAHLWDSKRLKWRNPNSNGQRTNKARPRQPRNPIREVRHDRRDGSRHSGESRRRHRPGEDQRANNNDHRYHDMRIEKSLRRSGARTEHGSRRREDEDSSGRHSGKRNGRRSRHRDDEHSDRRSERRHERQLRLSRSPSSDSREYLKYNSRDRGRRHDHHRSRDRQNSRSDRKHRRHHSNSSDEDSRRRRNKRSHRSSK